MTREESLKFLNDFINSLDRDECKREFELYLKESGNVNINEDDWDNFEIILKGVE